MVNNPAGFWRRFVALLLDGIIIGIIVTLLTFFIFRAPPDPDVFAAQDVFSTLVWWVYLIFLPLIWSGYVIGKAIVGIRICRVDGQNVRLSNMVLRVIIGGLVYAITFGIGFIVSLFMVIFRQDKRSLHDLIAGTYVTKDKPNYT